MRDISVLHLSANYWQVIITAASGDQHVFHTVAPSEEEAGAVALAEYITSSIEPRAGGFH